MAQPFEFLKTGMQLSRPGQSAFDIVHPLKRYFTGASVLNVGAVLKTSARFTTFETACKLLKDPDLPRDAPLTGPRLVMASILTGTVESIWIIPFENVKTTMIENVIQKEVMASQNPLPLQKNLKPTFHKRTKMSVREANFRYYENNPSEGMLNNIKEIYLTRGARGFLQGTMPTLIRQVGNSTVRFTVYSMLKQLMSSNGDFNEYMGVALGITTSIAVVGVTQPIDVIKTRMQSKNAWKYYRNSVNCCYRMFIEEGAVSLWKGAVPRLFKVSLSGGLSFGIYEYTENIIKQMKSDGYIFK